MADPGFLQGLDELLLLHLSKGDDYADESDPLRNYTVSGADNGLPAWRAAQLRLSEKYHRLVNLTRGGERVPNHESIDDTLMDLAALALIVRSLRARVAGEAHGPAVSAPAIPKASQYVQDTDPGDEHGAASSRPEPAA